MQIPKQKCENSKYSYLQQSIHTPIYQANPVNNLWENSKCLEILTNFATFDSLKLICAIFSSMFNFGNDKLYTFQCLF